jgi:predicted ribosome quality control (RQC) complex YloA/Tae2 family protein
MNSKGYPIKRAFSSLDVAVIVYELKSLIIGSLVDNIYSDSTGGLILKLRSTSGEDHYLLIKPSERLHITKNISRLENIGRVPLFRRYLNGLKIIGVEQLEFERIAVLSFGGRESYRLYVELIPRGILALTDTEGKVLMSNKEFKGKDREVVMGRKYILPPMFRDFRKLSTDEWFEKLSNYKSLTQGLTRGLGVPPEVVNEVLSGYTINIVDKDVVSEIRGRIIAFVDGVLKKPEPVIIASKNTHEYLAFLTFKPSRLGDDLEVLPFNSFNEAVDNYFLQLTPKEVIVNEVRALDDELAKTEKLINDLKKELEDLKVRINELRKLHDLVAMNYDVLDSISKCVWDTVKTLGWDYVGRCGIKDYDKSKGIVKVVLGGTAVELNVREGVKSFLIRLKSEIKECEDKIMKVDEVINNLLMKRDKLRKERDEVVTPLIRKVDWYDKYHWILTSDGLLSIGGRDAKQNEKIVRKYLTDNDIFMHADIAGASVFIIKCDGKIPSEKSLYEVATLAACYSRGWREGFGSLDVFWVYGRQVSKKAPAGEYLGLGSFMIYGEKNYLKNIKLELALGVSISGNYYKLIVGPEDYIRSRCRVYVVLQPGSEGKEAIAKKIVRYFIEKERRLKYLDVNSVVSKIPGPSRVVSTSNV